MMILISRERSINQPRSIRTQKPEKNKAKMRKYSERDESRSYKVVYIDPQAITCSRANAIIREQRIDLSWRISRLSMYILTAQ